MNLPADKVVLHVWDSLQDGVAVELEDGQVAVEQLPDVLLVLRQLIRHLHVLWMFNLKLEWNIGFVKMLKHFLENYKILGPPTT